MKTGADVARLPLTVKILLENIARRVGGRDVSAAGVVALAHWPNAAAGSIAFVPARVLMQDFTGVPAVVDLAALRSAVARSGGDPNRVNPCIPVDLARAARIDRLTLLTGSAREFFAHQGFHVNERRAAPLEV